MIKKVVQILEITNPKIDILVISNKFIGTVHTVLMDCHAVPSS